jgi:hypothetical protein
MLPIFHDSTSESMMAYRASQLQRFLVAQAQGTHPPTRFLVARDRDAHADEPLLGLVVWQVLHEPQVEGSQDSEKGGVLPKTAPMPHDSDEEAFAALKREAQAALDRCTQGRPVCCACNLASIAAASANLPLAQTCPTSSSRPTRNGEA